MDCSEFFVAVPSLPGAAPGAVRIREVAVRGHAANTNPGSSVHPARPLCFSLVSPAFRWKIKTALKRNINSNVKSFGPMLCGLSPGIRGSRNNPRLGAVSERGVNSFHRKK